MSIITISPISTGIVALTQNSITPTVITINQGQQGPAGPSLKIDNYGDNRLTTSDGSASGLYAETNLTFDGILRVSGTPVSISGHTHSSTDISNFNSSVSGLLPVKNIVAGSGIGISSVTGVFTVNVSGLTSDNIGNFNEAVDDRIGSGLFVAGTGISLSYNDSSNSFTVSTTGVSFNGHTHTVQNITDITSAGSGIVTASSYAAQNRLGWEIVSTNITAQAGGQYLLPKSASVTTLITISDPASASNGDFYTVVKNSGSAAITTVIGGVSYPRNSGVILYRIYNTDSISPFSASWKSFTLDHYHQHTANNIVDISGYVNNNIEIYFSGLSIISNNCDSDYFVIRDSGNNTKLISVTGVAQAISVIDGGGVLYSGC